MAHNHHIILLTASDAQRVLLHCNHFHVKQTGTKHSVLFRVTSNGGQIKKAENGTAVTREAVLHGMKKENHKFKSPIVIITYFFLQNFGFSLRYSIENSAVGVATMSVWAKPAQPVVRAQHIAHNTLLCCPRRRLK
jgi:hypothetical protein